jgi:hypothetical protein
MGNSSGMSGIRNRLDLTVIADAPAKDDPVCGGPKGSWTAKLQTMAE